MAQNDDKSEKAEKSKRTFTITVNNNAFQTNEDELTGAQIKQLAGIPPDYELFLIRGNNSDPIADTQVVHISNHMAFRAIPAGSFGVYATTTEAR